MNNKPFSCHLPNNPRLSRAALLILALFSVSTLATASDTEVKTESATPEQASHADSIAPETAITVPVENYTAGRTTTFRGFATDAGESGINRVQIAIRDTNTELWFSFVDKTFGPIRDPSGKLVGITDAVLSNASAGRADWSISLTLPNGEYQFFALAIDNAENSQYSGKGVWPVSVPFSVK